jgi:hypothetical protein
MLEGFDVKTGISLLQTLLKLATSPGLLLKQIKVRRSQALLIRFCLSDLSILPTIRRRKVLVNSTNPSLMRSRPELIRPTLLSPVRKACTLSTFDQSNSSRHSPSCRQVLGARSDAVGAVEERGREGCRGVELHLHVGSHRDALQAAEVSILSLGRVSLCVFV